MIRFLKSLISKKNAIYYTSLIVLFTIIFFRPVKLIINNGNYYFGTGYSKQYEALKKRYYGSQYVVKNSPGTMLDQVLESFAGGAFLKGMNPILIVHDQPPLGRYIISLSILLFDNPITIPMFLNFLTIVVLILISKQVIKNTIISLIPVAIFANEPLFIKKFELAPLLEPIQLPFIILSIYFFMKGIGSKKGAFWFILTSAMLGFVISIRFFVLGTILLISMLLFFFFEKSSRKKTLTFLFSLPIALLILVLSYFRTIQMGYSPFQVFGIQKYIFFYHKSKFILPFSFWDLLLFNRWHTWWGSWSISSDSQWRISWPFSMVISLLGLIFSFLKKIRLTSNEKILTLWIICFSLFLSMGYSSTRYFLPLIPFLYILATSFFIKFGSILFQK